MLLLFTFDEPSSGSRTTENRPRPSDFTAPISSDATCETSFETLGVVLRPAQVVEVTGAGTRHSGKYFVTAVRHTIDATSHTMALELARNAWGA